MKRRSRRDPVTAHGCSGCDAAIALEAGPGLEALVRAARRAVHQLAAPDDGDCHEARMALARAQYQDLDRSAAGASRVLHLLSASQRLPDPGEWFAAKPRRPVELESMLEQALRSSEASAALRTQGIDVASLDALLALVSFEQPTFRAAGQRKLELRSKTLGTMTLPWSPAARRGPLLALLAASEVTLAGAWQDLRDIFAAELRQLEDAGPVVAAGHLADLVVFGIFILILLLVGGALLAGCAATENKVLCSLANGLLVLALILLNTLPLISLGKPSGSNDGEETLATGSPLTVHVQRAPGVESQLPPYPATT